MRYINDNAVICTCKFLYNIEYDVDLSMLHQGKYNNTDE